MPNLAPPPAMMMPNLTFHPRRHLNRLLLLPRRADTAASAIHCTSRLLHMQTLHQRLTSSTLNPPSPTCY